MKRARLVGQREGLEAVLHFGAALRNMREEAGTEKAVAVARGQGHRLDNPSDEAGGADGAFEEADARRKRESDGPSHQPLNDCGEVWARTGKGHMANGDAKSQSRLLSIYINQSTHAAVVSTY